MHLTLCMILGEIYRFTDSLGLTHFSCVFLLSLLFF